jgi:NADPH-dependent 2,4-dienoyl-CoA reductase/sulfur reductase-like enzyme
MPTTGLGVLTFATGVIKVDTSKEIAHLRKLQRPNVRAAEKGRNNEITPLLKARRRAFCGAGTRCHLCRSHAQGIQCACELLEQPNHGGGPESCSFNFKTLLDAIRIRNHVIEMFERADPDPSLRKPILTFVIAGGGFAGIELAGALNDFARGILADYPSLHPKELNIIVVHSQGRILPELSESLAEYAQTRMEDRGVVFRLNTRLTYAHPGVVLLTDGEIRAHTLVWTAGTAPNPLALRVEKDKRGAVVVDHTLAVPGLPGTWALDDCAAFRMRKQASRARPLHSSRSGERNCSRGISKRNWRARRCGNSVSIR